MVGLTKVCHTTLRAICRNMYEILRGITSLYVYKLGFPVPEFRVWEPLASQSLFGDGAAGL